MFQQMDCLLGQYVEKQLTKNKIDVIQGGNSDENLYNYS